MSGGRATPGAGLRAKFRAIARDRIARIAEGVDHLESGEERAEVVDALMREIHTLKGEARLVEFGSAASVSHVVEDLLLHAREVPKNERSAWYAIVYRGLDLVSLLVDADEVTSADDVDIEPFLLEAARAKAVPTERPARSSRIPAPREAASPTQTPESGTDVDELPAEKTDKAIGFARRVDSSIRIALDQLHDLTDLVGTLALEHDRSETQLGEIDDALTAYVADLEAVEASIARIVEEIPASYRPSGLRETAARARAIRKRRTELRRMLGTSRDHLFEFRLHLGELDTRVRTLRLQPLDAVFREYPRAARELATSQGKRIRLVVDGAGVDVDKEVLEKLGDPLIHLVRNAVDHGIESPDERLLAGKDAVGTISLRARQRGPFVEIRIEDDGAGVDVERVRRSAVRKGLTSQALADARTDAEIIRLIFEPGFSTMEKATEVSGRGVGLDVVKASVDALGGSVEVSSELGRGTTFVLTAPIAMVFTRALLVACGEATYAVPSEAIRRISDFDPERVRTTDGIGAVAIDDEWMAVVDLRTMFASGNVDRNARPCIVVVEHLDARVALLCDRLLGERPIVQRSFDPFLSRKKLLAGAAVLDSGALAILLDVAEIVRIGRAGSGSTRAPGAGDDPSEAGAARSLRALVVDDSEITRDLVASILRARAFEVGEAVNGREALRLLDQSTFDVVVTDLEMPVLDGFGLLREIRQRPDSRSLPVVVFSTRGADSDTRKAGELGADGYLVKGRFDEEELVDMVKRLAHGGRG